MQVWIFQKVYVKDLHRHLRWMLMGGTTLICLFASALPTFGQISIVPLMQEVSVNRGGRTRFELQIANRGSEPLSCAMQVYDLDVSVEGMALPVREETQGSCVDWLTFAPSSFGLQADEVQIVEGLLHAPKDALGGFYAFITCEFSIPSEPFVFGEQQTSKADIQLGHAVSSILLGTIRSSKNYVQLEPGSLVLTSGRGAPSDITPVSPASVADRFWEVVLPVENTGNIHTVAQGEVSIWTEDVRLVERAQLLAGRGYVFPGKKRLFRAQGTRPLADGVYMAKARLRTREGKFIQGSFPYCIVKGEAIKGAASEALRALIEASTPKFSLSKRLLDYKITPNAKRTKGINLKNHTSDTLSISARVATWALDDSGKVALNPDTSELTKPCVSWMSVWPDPISIPPKRSRAVKVTLAAPPEIEGEYYGGVIFETAETRQDLPTELELARTLLVMASSSRNLKHKAEIASFAHDPISPMMRAFVVDVTNKGNVHCFVSGKLEIYDKEWRLVMEPITFGGPHDYVLPDRVRGYVVPCPGSLKPGKYEAVVEVKYHDKDPAVISKMNFYAD
jgi:hypothetical protein